MTSRYDFQTKCILEQRSTVDRAYKVWQQRIMGVTDQDVRQRLRDECMAAERESLATYKRKMNAFDAGEIDD